MKSVLTKLIGVSILLLSLNTNAGVIYLEESGKVDDVLTINLMGTGFNDGLAAGSFYTAWDSSLLEFAGITFNESLYDFVNSVGYLDQASGYLDDGIFSALNGVDSSITSGVFEIATLTFTMLAEGISWIDVAQGWDVNGSQPYYDPSFNVITDVTFDGVFVQTSMSIPEPSTFAIFALGLIGLASRKVKK
jgi:hypothetical protein